MKRNSCILFTVAFCIFFCISIANAFAQTGTIAGRVLDERKWPMIGAVVEVMQENIRKGGAVSDYDGIFFINNLKEGTYNIRVSYSGYYRNYLIGAPIIPNKVSMLIEQLLPSPYKPETQSYLVGINDSTDSCTIYLYHQNKTGQISGHRYAANIQDKRKVDRYTPVYLKSVAQIPIPPWKKDGFNIDPYEPTKTIFTSDQIEKR